VPTELQEVRRNIKMTRAIVRARHASNADDELDEKLKLYRKTVNITEPKRILDFDIENRPLAYLGSDYTTAEITAIAACWMGEPKSMKVWLLTKEDENGRQTRTMLEGFVRMYNEADMITGHFIRGHDLPVINGALLENGLPPLGPKLSHDTKNDLATTKYISLSQENLGAMLKIAAPKERMNNPKWRDANRLTKSGIALTRKRVVADVIQHMQLYVKLRELKMLKAPKLWTGEGDAPVYKP
jgi:hypothetical protein